MPQISDLLEKLVANFAVQLSSRSHFANIERIKVIAENQCDKHKNWSLVACILTLCILGNFSCFCCRLLTFFKINFFKRFFQEQHRRSNGLDPDQDVGPDLGLNCLQRLSCFC